MSENEEIKQDLTTADENAPNESNIPSDIVEPAPTTEEITPEEVIEDNEGPVETQKSAEPENPVTPEKESAVEEPLTVAEEATAAVEETTDDVPEIATRTIAPKPAEATGPTREQSVAGPPVDVRNSVVNPTETKEILTKESPAEALIAATTPNYDFLKRKDQYIEPEKDLPEDVEFQLAKSFLMQNSEKSAMNLYDHLTITVLRLLETRPRNALDYFESISSEVKRSRFNPISKTSSPAFDPVEGIKLAKDQQKALEEEKVELPGEIPDIMDLSNLWDWAGVSFGKEETFMLLLSLQKLVTEKPLKSIRLWGKITGTNGSYIITEGELKEGVADEDGEIANAPPRPDHEEVVATAEGGVPTDPEDSTTAKSKVKIIPPLPKEVREGVNRYVYYVTAYPGAPWIRLPDVIPEKLQIARRIRKYFTGNLNHPIISYPVFDGNEAQYLRCQISRISAGTVISPLGYYTFDPEEEVSEEEGHQQTIIINPEFEGLTNEALLTLTNWVHHVPYILPQGRTIWVNPLAGISKSGNADGENDDDQDGGDDGEEQEEEEVVEPEVGPQILSPISGDEETLDGPAWISRACSKLSPMKFTPVTLRNTRWPGAIVVAYNDKFANLYVGDGQAYFTGGIDGLAIPPMLPEVLKEFVLIEKEENPDDPENPISKQVELKEQNDPTVEDEARFEESLKVKQEEGKEEEDEEEEKEEEEDDD